MSINMMSKRAVHRFFHLFKISKNNYSSYCATNTRKGSDYNGLLSNLKFNKMKYSSNPESNLCSNEDLLEKLIADLSTNIYQKSRVYKNDLLKIVSTIQGLNFSTPRQGIILLRCCTELLPDESPETRMELVEAVWNALKYHTNLTVDHYNELLKCYIANNRTVNANSFFKQMEPVKPNETTYLLTLKAVCEAGDINQAAELISNMKAVGIEVGGNAFNALIYGQGKAGNLSAIDDILTMMKSLKIEKTVNTHISIAKAYAVNDKVDLMFKELGLIKKKGLLLEEEHIMDLVKCLAVKERYQPIQKVLTYLPESILSNPSISPYMQTVTTQLVFQNRPLVALELFKCLPMPTFVPTDDKGLHGRSLVRDCVKASVPSAVISQIAYELMKSGRNPIALQSACEAALQMSKGTLALELFDEMKKVGLPLRVHYFWPVFISRKSEEKGIVDTLSCMLKKGVQPDFETLTNYILPYMNLNSPENLVRKLSEHGLKVVHILTPVLSLLLNNGQLNAAMQLCETFKSNVDFEKLSKSLINGYMSQQDIDTTVRLLNVLRARSEQNVKDWTGRFLCDLLNHKNMRNERLLCVKFVESLKSQKAKISQSAADLCVASLGACDEKNETISILKTIIYELVDGTMSDESDTFQAYIPHPRDMKESQLRAHLVELESKGMNTRGVLRKLLQYYCRTNRSDAAKQLLEKCQRENVTLSPGMKAAIFDLYIKTEQLDAAIKIVSDLTRESPRFNLDDHKLLDFATLLVKNDRLDEAMEFLEERSKSQRILGGRAIETNCWRLLDSVVNTSQPERVEEFFHLLVEKGFSSPSNVILGPLVRFHLKRDEIKEAVETFKKLYEVYKQTPLKHELLVRLLQRCEDGMEFATDVSFILQADKKIHGEASFIDTSIGSLAEAGHTKSLTTLLKNTPPRLCNDSLSRVSKWLCEKQKIDALKNILATSVTIDHSKVDYQPVYSALLRIYQRNDDNKSAFELWEELKANNLPISNDFNQNITSFLQTEHENSPHHHKTHETRN